MKWVYTYICLNHGHNWSYTSLHVIDFTENGSTGFFFQVPKVAVGRVQQSLHEATFLKNTWAQAAAAFPLRVPTRNR